MMPFAKFGEYTAIWDPLLIVISDPDTMILDPANADCVISIPTLKLTELLLMLIVPPDTTTVSVAVWLFESLTVTVPLP